MTPLPPKGPATTANDGPKVVDPSGTVGDALTRKQVEERIQKLIVDNSAEAIAGLKDPEDRKKAEDFLKKVQTAIALGNMWMNAALTDGAAVTVGLIERTFHLSEFLAYQAEFNKALAEKVDRLERR